MRNDQQEKRTQCGNIATTLFRMVSSLSIPRILHTFRCWNTFVASAKADGRARLHLGNFCAQLWIKRLVLILSFAGNNSACAADKKEHGCAYVGHPRMREKRDSVTLCFQKSGGEMNLSACRVQQPSRRATRKAGLYVCQVLCAHREMTMILF